MIIGKIILGNKGERFYHLIMGSPNNTVATFNGHTHTFKGGQKKWQLRFGGVNGEELICNSFCFKNQPIVKETDTEWVSVESYSNPDEISDNNVCLSVLKEVRRIKRTEDRYVNEEELGKLIKKEGDNCEKQDTFV